MALLLTRSIRHSDPEPQPPENGLLLVPTATMAEHLRHSFTRAGIPTRPRSIQTLGGFLDTLSPLKAAPPALVELLVERVLAKQRPARFQAVAQFPGVIRALASLFAEVSGDRLPADVGRLFAEVERALAARSMGPRHARLAAAAKEITAGASLPPQITFEGFFKFSEGESLLIAALSRRTRLTVSLPDWPGAERAREALLAGGFEERSVPARISQTPATLFTAATMEREAEEIARRILSSGRAFREIGIILRSRDPYGPLMETVLSRFGIPARSYFADTLAAHPAIQYRSDLIRSALAGWDHQLLLRALRMPASGLGGTKAGDERDFAMRETLPAHGWGETWHRQNLEPAQWAKHLKATRAWAPALRVEDHADPLRLSAWRSTALAMAAFDEAVDATAAAFDGEVERPLSEFWRHLERTLSQEQLRVPDLRRNVVHILDAYESRQWSLPLVFVCGLTERHFPQYHREDSVVGDAALRRAGLDTAADRAREEKFLFELATSRATVETILSYPRFDQDGQQTLPSFFLQGMQGVEVTASVRPQPARTIAVPRPAPIQDERILLQHKTLSASSVETYMQCPFQFFTRKTLRLRERPKAPRDRLDALLQGTILHNALAEWARRPLLGSAVLEEAFLEECTRAHVLRTYRSEAVRLELLRHFNAFIEDRTVALGWESRVEEGFEFALNGGVSVRGRIDRLDVAADGRALVIDYKYSAAGRAKERIQESAAGNLVQAGVYLLAAERYFNLRPAGMLFCHMKKGVAWDGWHTGLPPLAEVGENRGADTFAELAQTAETNVLRVHQEIASGRVDVRPADTSKCAWCAARDVCRVESITAAEFAEGAA